MLDISMIKIIGIIFVLVLVLSNMSVSDYVNAVQQHTFEPNINTILFNNCTEAIKHLFGVRIEPIVTVYSNGYKVYIYYAELGYRAIQRTRPASGIIHDQMEGIVVFCKGGNRIIWFEVSLEKLAKKLAASNKDLGNRVMNLYKEISNISKYRYYCNGTLLLSVSKSNMNKALQLVKVFVNEVLSRASTYLGVKRIAICGLNDSPTEALSEETYEKIDALLRKLYPGLDLGLMHYECGKRRGIWGWRNPLTGLPVLPVTTKYYEEVVRGNKSIARAIGLAVADVLHRIGYPLKTVEVRLRPPGILVCRFGPEPVKGNLTVTLAKLARSVTNRGTTAGSGKEKPLSTTLITQRNATSISSAKSEEVKSNITITTKMIEKQYSYSNKSSHYQAVTAVKNPSSKANVTRSEAVLVATVVALSLVLFAAIALTRRK